MNSLDFFFKQFLGILSHKAREKEKLPIFESLAKSLEDKELWIKNQNKATANYAKQFFKKKSKFSTTDFAIGSASKYKFCEKKYRLDKYWHLQAECHYCHEIDHIAKFYKKKISPQASTKWLVTCTQCLLYNFTSLESKAHVFCSINTKFLELFVSKVIINSGATNNFFFNCIYF